MANPALHDPPVTQVHFEDAVEAHVPGVLPEAAPRAEDVGQIATLELPTSLPEQKPNQNVDDEASTAAMDYSINRGNANELPSVGCNLTAEDTEAVITLVTLANNHRSPPANSSQATEQYSPDVSIQEEIWNPEDRDDDIDTAEATTIEVSSRDFESEETSSEKSKFDCNQCGKYYATSSNLSRHKQTHRSLNSDLAQRCRDCNKVYVSMSALAMHMLTHRMRHVCRVCGKQFSRPWLLRGHLRSHTGEKPYKCIACGKSFADRSNLRAHLQTHSPDKKFQCMRCNKTFALKTYLNKHHESACARFRPNTLPTNRCNE